MKDNHRGFGEGRPPWDEVGSGGHPWRHHPRGGRDQGWGTAWGTGWGPGGGRRGERGGPPPWVAGLFGLAQGLQTRTPKVRRGDVRAAILDVLAEGPRNGYQVIQEIGERTGGAWRPSPGSVYPTIAQLEDEGLVEADAAEGRRTLRLTDSGRSYVGENAEELAGVWQAFESGEPEPEEGYAALKPEIAGVMNAAWQIISTGTDQQRRDAVQVLVETRRRLYGLLADGDVAADDDEE